jgi:site-specific DNA-methyltransferase (adenine-specific)
MTNFGKETDERETPIELFKELDDEFHFELDVCAMNWNTKCTNYFNIGHNGLKQIWAPKICFMNCPYSDIPSWLKKSKQESIKGAIVVAILPTDSSTHWFHNYIWDKLKHNWRDGIQVRFPNKRYKFSNTNSAKFATMIVIFRTESCQHGSTI